MGITIKLLCASGHRKYADLIPEEAAKMIEAIEQGKVKGAPAGPYFVINKNTRRIVGKLDIKDNQELVMMPQIRGG